MQRIHDESPEDVSPRTIHVLLHEVIDSTNVKSVCSQVIVPNMLMFCKTLDFFKNLYLFS